jgi:hypothetical protein
MSGLCALSSLHFTSLRKYLPVPLLEFVWILRFVRSLLAREVLQSVISKLPSPFTALFTYSSIRLSSVTLFVQNVYTRACGPTGNARIRFKLPFLFLFPGPRHLTLAWATSLVELEFGDTPFLCFVNDDFDADADAYVVVEVEMLEERDGGAGWCFLCLWRSV